MDSSGNLPLAILAGIAAAVVGALIWMGITVALGIHVGYVALGVGALVGFAVRAAGKGSTIPYGIIGAVCTLLGCIGGEMLAVIQLAASHNGVGFFQVLNQLDPPRLLGAIVSSASPITYFIYAIGIYEGFKLSIVPASQGGMSVPRR